MWNFTMKNKTNLKQCSLSLIFLSLILFQSVLIISAQTSNTMQLNNTSNYTLKAQNFEKDDYSSILRKVKSGLGSVSVLNFSFHEKGFVNYSSQFPDLEDDISQEGLNVSYLGTIFNKTISNASRNYLNDEYIDQNTLSIMIKESIEVAFDNNSDSNGLSGYILYLPRLYPIEIEKIYVNNSLLDESEYSIEMVDNSYQFIKFNYYDKFGEMINGHFSLDFLFSYILTLESWEITQLNSKDLLVQNETQNVRADYKYSFEINGKKYTGNRPSISTNEASNLTLSLQVSPFDMAQLINLSLSLNGDLVSDISNYLFNDNINISLGDSFTANGSTFILNFSSDFEIKFLEAVGNFWAIDRLARDADIRQRIYFPSVVDGPKHLLIKFTIDEPSIGGLQYRNHQSQFDRSFGVFRSPQGIINITTPALIRGELACPFIIKYQVEKSLKLVVTDNLNMPLIGVDVIVLYYDRPFGTYISKSSTQPIAPLSTDQNGEIILKNLPNGNYTIQIYRNGNLRAIQIVSTNTEEHYIKTNILHIPVVIMVFGGISTITLVIGIILYLRNKIEH